MSPVREANSRPRNLRSARGVLISNSYHFRNIGFAKATWVARHDHGLHCEVAGCLGDVVVANSDVYDRFPLAVTAVGCRGTTPLDYPYRSSPVPRAPCT